MGHRKVKAIPLSHDPSSVALARQFVGTALSGPVVPDAQLVVSELVSNAVLYTAGSIMVTLKNGAKLVTVAVWDEDPTVVPRLADAPSGRPGGRGLKIVAALSERWGYRFDPPGKTVWAMLRVRPLPLRKRAGSGDSRAAFGGRGIRDANGTGIPKKAR